MINNIETVITIKDKDKTIPALATAQILSLFGLTTQVLTHAELEKVDWEHPTFYLASKD